MAMGRMKRGLTSRCSKRWTPVNVGTSVAQLVNKVTVAHIHHEERWGENPICEPRVTKRGKGITNGRDIDSDEESAERREGNTGSHVGCGIRCYKKAVGKNNLKLPDF